MSESQAYTLFGQDVCPNSDIEACTRNPQEVILKIGNKVLTFFVINQADKIEPFREWDVVNHESGIIQCKNLRRIKAILVAVLTLIVAMFIGKPVMETLLF